MMELVIAAATLLVASAYDLKSREIPDWVWIPGIVLGSALRLIDIEGTLHYLAISWPFLLALALLLAVEWFFSMSGQADVLAYASLMIIATEPASPFPPPFLTYLLSKILFLSILPFQLIVNLIRVSREPDMLKGFEEPAWRKILALLILSPYSKHLSVGARIAETSEGGVRKFLLRAAMSPIGEKEDEGGILNVGREVSEGRTMKVWIAPTYPMIPFILSAYLIIRCSILLP